MRVTGLVTALRTLTLLPIPGRDAPRLSQALPWFPWVGLMLGALLSLAAWAMGLLTAWPEAAALLIVTGSALLSGGLHLDGLADWADGFWGARDRENVLRIMKDSRIGAFGVIALGLVLGAQWLCLTRLLQAGAYPAVVASFVISRCVMVELAASQPYARPEGGTAQGFVADATARHRMAALGGTLLILVLLSRGHWIALIPAAAAWLFAQGFGRVCRRRIGGITGDLLGAAAELTLTLALFAYALV